MWCLELRKSKMINRKKNKQMKKLLKSLFRKSKHAFRKAFGRYVVVSATDLDRVTPISANFGIDRGKPIDRYYIEKFLYQNRKYVKGRILEVAENLYATRYAQLNETASEASIVETLHYDGIGRETTMIGDLTKIETLPENRYDCFICTQVYMFIFDVAKALEGSCHLLKEGGVLLATVAGISQISREDMDKWGDYWRFTNKTIELLLKETKFSQIEVVPMGNVMAACAFLQGIALEEIPNKELLDVNDNNFQLIIGIKAIK